MKKKYFLLTENAIYFFVLSQESNKNNIRCERHG
jgi:hypothetical protein